MKIKLTATYVRNVKALKKKHYDLTKLEKAVEYLVKQDSDTLKRVYKDHQLHGNRKGYRELHVEADWLLVYRIENNALELILVATGSHDQVFRNT